MHSAARDLHASPLAARKRVAARGADVAQVELVDQPLGPGAAFAVAQRLRLQHGQDVLFDSQLAKDRRLLGQIADAEVARAQIHRRRA